MRTHLCRAGGSTSLLAFIAFLLAAASTRADAADKLPESLRLVPADAVLYSASLRNAEQWKAITSSKAWEKLTTLESVAPFWKMAQDWTKAKDNREILDLLADMAGQEVFFYGGAAYADTAVLMQYVYAAVQMAPRMAALGVGRANPQQVQVAASLHTLLEHRDKIKAPGLIVGFRLDNPKQAEAQLKKVEEMLGNLVEQAATLKGRLKRQEVGKASYVTLTLDGKMVPWKELIPWRNFEAEAGQFDPLIRKLEGVKLTLSAGVRDRYLLLSLDETTKLLTTLGGDNPLADRPELKPLAKFAGRHLTGISYSSKSLNASTATTKDDVNATIEFVESALEPLGLKEEELKIIRKDLAELGKQWKGRLPVAGAALHFSFATERGSESYAHDWTQYPGQPRPAPLPILKHLGGDPLMAFVAHSTTNVEDYRSLVKWIKTADSHIDKLVLSRLDEDTRKHVEQGLKLIRPLVRQLDDVTSKKLMPALADGQMALVIDARLKSKQWLKALGATPKALPLLEPAVVVGVSDADLLQQALGDYRQIVNKLLEQARELGGEGFPELNVPAANKRTTKAGVFYSIAVAEATRLDRQIELNAGVSEKVAVFGLSRATTERLLAAKPLDAGGPLARAGDRDLLAASYVNWEGTVKAVAPWIEMGVDAMLNRFIDEDEKEKLASIRKQVTTVLEVLTVFRSYASVTFVEDKATVTHGESVFRDLEK